MRLPRIRFTIARLMALILILALSIGIALEIRSRKAYRQARLARELAEYALQEYTEGVYPQDLATARGQVALSKSDLERSTDRLKWSTAMKDKGQLTGKVNVADQLTKQQAEFDVEQARSQLKILEEYTRQKRIKGLMSDIERTRADEQVKLRACQSERAWRIWWGSGN